MWRITFEYFDNVWIKDFTTKQEAVAIIELMKEELPLLDPYVDLSTMVLEQIVNN